MWLTDFKYADDDLARRYSGAENYRETALEALREEVGQSASAEYYFDGKSKLMRRGVIVRHLCLAGASARYRGGAPPACGGIRPG